MIRATLVLLALLGILPPAQAAERWLDLNSGSQALVLADAVKPKPLPALVMLPYTDGTSTAIFSRYSSAIRRQSRQTPLVVVLPPGSNDSGDYDDYEDWAETIASWEWKVRAAIKDLVRLGWVDPDKVLLAGHSMGGDLSWALSLRRPQEFHGALVMGSRCSWRPLKPVPRGKLPAQFLVMGARDSSSRQRGMHAAVRFLSYRGEHFLFRQHTGGHVPAPESVFLAGLNYLLLPPAAPVKSTAQTGSKSSAKPSATPTIRPPGPRTVSPQSTPSAPARKTRNSSRP